MNDLIFKKQLNHTLASIDIDGLGPKYSGKVRETYKNGDQLILVTTDRISAFDHILNQTIPFKGQVLNQLAAYFFSKTSDLVPNHVISVPDPNVTIATLCEPFPVEFVVRGYLVGHAWRTYQSGLRTLCGVSLPDGLVQNSPFPTPILTPTTKVDAGHDEDISRLEIISQGLIDEATFDELAAMSLRLFARGSRMALDRSLILVDTKYEFGRTRNGKLIVIDEVHTPDSSRYFYADTFRDRLEKRAPQRQLSKEFVREWLMDHDFRGIVGQPLPDLPDSFRIEISKRYIELFETITGTPFSPDTHPDPAARIHSSLSAIAG